MNLHLTRNHIIKNSKPKTGQPVRLNVKHHIQHQFYTHFSIHLKKQRKTYQLCTSPTEGLLSKLSGNKLTSLMVLASRTGSSFRRNMQEVFSHALSRPVIGEEKNTHVHCSRSIFRLASVKRQEKSLEGKKVTFISTRLPSQSQHTFLDAFSFSTKDSTFDFLSSPPSVNDINSFSYS